MTKHTPLLQLLLILLILLVGCSTGLPQTETVPQETPPATIATLPAETVPVETQPEETQPEEEPPITGLGYYGSRLDPREQQLYAQISQAISNQAATFTLRISADWIPDSQTASDMLFDILSCVHDDHAEYFWFHGVYQEYDQIYSFQDNCHIFTLTQHYFADYHTVTAQKAEIEARCIPFLNAVADLPEWDKALAVYDYLGDITDYDTDYTGTSMYNLFGNGKAVCYGYARAAQYLFDALDMECIYVYGQGMNSDGPGSHAWNIVKIDGEYCQFDATWGDFWRAEHSLQNYQYFCCTTEEMQKDHIADWDELPLCTASELTYFKKLGLYTDSFSEEFLVERIRQTRQEGSTDAGFQCADAELMEYYMDQLITTQLIYTVWEQAAGNTDYPAFLVYHSPETNSIVINWS